MSIPPIAQAVVVSQDWDNYAVNVMILGFGGGQMPALPVKVATHGARDGVRGNFPDLPQIGNHGIVAFLREDTRSGVWLGTFENNLVDSGTGTPGVAGPAYHAAYNGSWHWSGPDGTMAAVLADGTSFLAGGTMPVPTRHTLDQNQRRQTVPYTQAQRVPNPPRALPLSLTHPSGTSVSLGSGGAVTVTVAGGATLTIGAGGAVNLTAASVVINSGNVQLGGAGGKKVALDGDPVIGGGGGTIQASSTHVRAT